jgi:hypothetical protein
VLFGETIVEPVAETCPIPGSIVLVTAFDTSHDNVEDDSSVITFGVAAKPLITGGWLTVTRHDLETAPFAFEAVSV